MPSNDFTREHRVLLGVLLALLLLLLGILGWSFFHTTSNRFQIGSRPTDMAEPKKRAPTLPVLHPTDPSKGSMETGVARVVLFADYTCLYCRGVALELERVASAGIPFHYIWRDLPHTEERPDGVIASAAGRCAQEQRLFWPYHQLLLTAKSFDLTTLQSLATEAGLQRPAFDSCMQSGKYIGQIQQEADEARKTNITSTPTIFVGDTVIEGYATAEELRALIQRENR